MIISEENQFCSQTDSRPGNDPLPESVVGTESIHSLGRALDIGLQDGRIVRKSKCVSRLEHSSYLSIKWYGGCGLWGLY